MLHMAISDAGCLSKFQRSVFYIIYNPYAVLFVIVCILLNTLFMAVDHHDMSPELYNILRFGNYVSISVPVLFVARVFFSYFATQIVVVTFDSLWVTLCAMTRDVLVCIRTDLGR